MKKDFNLNEGENFKKEDIKDCIIKDVDVKDSRTLNLLIYVFISVFLLAMICFNGYCMGVILFHKSYKHLLVSVLITIITIYNTSSLKNKIKEFVEEDKFRHEILKRMTIAENIYGIILEENEDPLILLGFTKKRGKSNDKTMGAYEKIRLSNFNTIETSKINEITVYMDKMLIYVPKQ